MDNKNIPSMYDLKTDRFIVRSLKNDGNTVEYDGPEIFSVS